MSFDESLVSLIDQRVRAYDQKTQALGTCVARDGIGAGASVLFDGATVAVPVKVLGHVELREEMRCTLDKYGSEWLVTGAFATPVMGKAVQYAFAQAGGITTTSASYVDVTGLNPFEFFKLHDATSIQFGITASGFASTAACIARWALRFTQLEGATAYTSTDNFQGPQIGWNVVSQRNHSHAGTISNEVVPAGRYSVQLRWKRVSGTGTCNSNSDDLLSCLVEEVLTNTSPYV